MLKPQRPGTVLLTFIAFGLTAIRFKLGFRFHAFHVVCMRNFIANFVVFITSYTYTYAIYLYLSIRAI